jgi:hypothetical protein
VARLAALSLVALALLPGCLLSSRGPSVYGTETESGGAQAAADVLAAVPAMEAYYADNGTYEGATPAVLRKRYDAGIPDVSIKATATTYCIECGAGDDAVHRVGPSGELLPGPCP